MSTSKKKIQIDPHIKALLGMMAFVLILMAILKGDTYFTIPNLRSMFFQFPEYGILTFGMMMCMIAGGIDLSLVGIMNLAGLRPDYQKYGGQYSLHSYRNYCRSYSWCCMWSI